MSDNMPEFLAAMLASEQQTDEHPPQDAETQSLAEMDEVQTEFAKRARQEERRYNRAVDSEYWVAICFQSREQKEEFLAKTRLARFGDKYLDGTDVAASLGVELAPEGDPPRTRGIDRDFLALTLGVDYKGGAP